MSAYLIDTDIAIHLRDVEPSIATRIRQLPALPAISLVTWIELEGGIARDPANAARRRHHTDVLLGALTVHPLDPAVVVAYGMIVAACGFYRTRVFDRLIAATAIVHDATLLTINAADFRDIPDLKLEAWRAPQ